MPTAIIFIMTLQVNSALAQQPTSSQEIGYKVIAPEGSAYVVGQVRSFEERDGWCIANVLSDTVYWGSATEYKLRYRGLGVDDDCSFEKYDYRLVLHGTDTPRVAYERAHFYIVDPTESGAIEFYVYPVEEGTPVWDGGDTPRFPPSTSSLPIYVSLVSPDTPEKPGLVFRSVSDVPPAKVDLQSGPPVDLKWAMSCLDHLRRPDLYGPPLERLATYRTTVSMLPPMTDSAVSQEIDWVAPVCSKEAALEITSTLSGFPRN